MFVSLTMAQNDTWTARQNYAGGGRTLGTSFSIGAKVYAGTGMTGASIPTDDFYEYDVASNAWTSKGNFDGGARIGAISFSINGKGYVAFGTDLSSGFKDIWEYTPAGDTWEKKTDFPGLGRAGGFVFVVNNKAYIGGGQDENGVALNDLWVFDPSGYTWMELESLPSTPRLYPAAFAIGTKGYVGTGVDENDNSLSDFWEYNTATNTWTRKADHPSAIAGAIGFATSTRGYMGLAQSTELYSYYPTENVWIKEADYPVAGFYINASCAFSGGKAYVGLGQGISFSPAYYVYTPGSDQSITFGALTAKTFGNAPFGLTATASSSLTVTYTSSNTSVATVSGSTLTIVGAGTTTITAKQAGNGTFDAALPVEQTLTVNKASQTITFGTLVGKNMGEAPFGLTATASSTLGVSYSSSNTSVATIVGSTVTIVGAGTTTITASQAGNPNYNAATSVDQALVVSKLNQTITFGTLSSKHAGDIPFALTAIASSGLVVSYISSNTAVATVSGSTVTVVGSGTTTITASQAGNTTYNAATSVDQGLSVLKGTQTWIGSLPTAGGYGNDITITLLISSGLPYTLTSSDPNIATVAFNGTNHVISPKGIGTTTLTATHPGNADFEATTITASLVISKGIQTIVVDDIPARKYLDGFFPIVATSSSGLPVTFDPLPLNSAVTINNNIVSASSSFNGTITARVAGNDFYLPADKAINIVIGKANATLTMDPISEKVVGAAAFTPVVKSGRYTIPYTLSSTNPAVAQISSGRVLIVGKGSTNIYAATNVSQSFTASSTFQTLVVKEDHTITFAQLPTKTLGDAPFEVTASSSASVPVTFATSDPSVAMVEGNTITIKAVGQVMIIASGGNGTYAMKSVSQVLTVKNIAQTTSQQGQLYGILGNIGNGNAGAIYKANNDGTDIAIVKAFKESDDGGGEPRGSLTLGSNGKFYGCTSKGGTRGGGVLFEYDPATGTNVVKYNFALADYPVKTFVATPNGKIYGAKSGNIDDELGPLIFEFDLNTGTFTKKKNVSDLINSISDVFMTSDGKIYITGSAGTAQEYRVFAQYDPAANTLTKKAQITTPGGSTMSGPVEAVNGKVYGTTQVGGANAEGVIYEFDPAAGTVAIKLDFPKANFNTTMAQGLMKASNGKIYGMASYGGNQTGYIYEYKPDVNTMTVLVEFQIYVGVPTGKLTEASNGMLYGTDNSGGAGGTLFEFNPITLQLRTLFVFNKNTGLAVSGNLGVKGDKLYGTCARGGTSNQGTLFEFEYNTRTITTKVNFKGSADGHSPMMALAMSGNGKMYGVTKFGGPDNGGTIFEVDPVTDEYNTLFEFTSTTGGNPQAPLLAGLDGKLYGSTGPAYGSPSLFQFDPVSGVYETLWYLSVAEGSGINHQLIQSNDGKLYGLMPYGGANGSGVLFELDPVTRVYRRLVDFATAIGSGPMMAPIIASNGKIYGTTPAGGAFGGGVLFEYDLSTNTYTVKHNFSAGTGTKPKCIPIEVDGKLWGATSEGSVGSGSYGVVFQFDLATGVYTAKTAYESVGANSGGKFLLASNGKLYGLTGTGGPHANGTISEYDFETNKLTLKSEMPFYGSGLDPLGWLVQTVISSKKGQTIAITPVATKVLGEGPFTPSATATSGLTVVFTAGSSNITVGADGKVTMAQAGKATLKANQAGNASYSAAPEAQVIFCVNPAKPAIAFSTTSNGTVSLSAAGPIGNQWYKDGTAISGAVNGSYEATTPGVYTLITTIDGCVSEVSDPKPVIVTGDIEANHSISLYPNPVQDKLYIILPGNNLKKVTLLQTDGRIAAEHDTSAPFLEVDVRSYAAGLYLVHIRDEQGSHPAMKFIKK